MIFGLPHAYLYRGFSRVSIFVLGVETCLGGGNLPQLSLTVGNSWWSYPFSEGLRTNFSAKEVSAKPEHHRGMAERDVSCKRPKGWTRMTKPSGSRTVRIHLPPSGAKLRTKTCPNVGTWADRAVMVKFTINTFVLGWPRTTPASRPQKGAKGWGHLRCSTAGSELKKS